MPPRPPPATAIRMFLDIKDSFELFRAHPERRVRVTAANWSYALQNAGCRRRTACRQVGPAAWLSVSRLIRSHNGPVDRHRIAVEGNRATAERDVHMTGCIADTADF